MNRFTSSAAGLRVAASGTALEHPKADELHPRHAAQRLPCNGPIRMLRLAQVLDATGLGKTKIYELQSKGEFPMRVKITSHTVGWVEEEVQAWLMSRVSMNCASQPG
jgi:prophage regulatory protein